VVPLGGARIVVTIDRGIGFHADAHICYPDGRYVLVDVMGDDMQADVRSEGWEVPPCLAQ
jgi:hypothetical protein